MPEPSIDPQLRKQLDHLERHLERENPILLEIVRSFRMLDGVARRLGYFGPDESYATGVPWWPIISVLGIYSAGKSTFINEYLGYDLQLTGNQAVDDKFTVITYSKEHEVRVLPGLALDADPRFPFYRISREIDQVAAGEGRRIDAYLQLKTCPSERLRGKILIDSPGFDADEQRTAVLRITNYIVDLSDLVLVFFDARKPESGTMGDTLRHLVSETIHRQDSNKFLYVLNQVDTTAREDNAEDVVSAWQRGLAQKGLTAGRFYRIYSQKASNPIEDENVRVRYEHKRDTDLADMDTRIQQVGVERSYRVVGTLERTAKDLEQQVVPRLRQMLASWRKGVLWLDGAFLVVVLVAIGALGAWSTLGTWLTGGGLASALAWAVLVVVLGGLHAVARKLAAGQVLGRLRRQQGDSDEADRLARALRRNTRFYRSIFLAQPAGWGPRSRHTLRQVLADAGDYVQQLNNAFTNPSGKELNSAHARVEADTPDAAA
jgi:hypothetical protein